MELLSKYSPAEVLFILKGNDVTLSEYISYTFRDLILRGVISSKPVVKMSHNQDPARVLRYLCAGKNYIRFVPKIHEEIFSETLSNFKMKQAIIRYVIKDIFKKMGNQITFRNKVLENDSMKPIAYRNFFDVLIGKYSTTDLFDKTQVELRKEINILADKIPTLAKENPLEITAIINKIKGNIFHINGFDMRMIRDIDPGLLKDANTDYTPLMEPFSFEMANDWDIFDLFEAYGNLHDSDNTSFFDWDFD